MRKSLFSHKSLMSCNWGTCLQPPLLLLLFAAGVCNCSTYVGCRQTLGGSDFMSGVIPDTDCNYLISAPDTEHQIQLQFQREYDPNKRQGEEVRFRAFEVYDGASIDAPLLLRASNPSIHTPPLWSAISTSLDAFKTSSSDNLLFRSLPGLSGYGGLHITYNITACPMNPKQSDSRSGHIESPGYSLPAHNPGCSAWFLQADSPDSVITISFDDLNLTVHNRHGSSLCLMDFVKIGPDPEVSFCGQIYNGKPRTYRSNRNHVWIKYRHSGNGRDRGFSLSYIAGPADERSCGDGEFKCRDGGCILQYWVCNGAYECADSSDEQGCSTTTQQHTTTSTTTYTTTSMTTTSTGPPPVDMECPGSSRGCINNYGVHQCLPISSWCDGKRDCAKNEDEATTTCYSSCNRTLHGPTGLVFSPNFPFPYPANAHCLYTLVAPPGGHVRLTLHHLALGLHSYVRGNHDQVAVYDGDSEDPVNRRLLARFVGVLPPKTLTSTGNVMYVEMTTDAAIQDAGFNATYRIIECSKKVLTDRRGRILSVNFDNIVSAPVCQNWTVLGHMQNDIVILSFKKIDLPSSDLSSCPDNYIQLGPHPVRRLCGDHTRAVAYISNNCHVSIQYKWRGDKAGNGFSLEYIITRRDAGSCLAEEFACASGGCVMARWRCNGATECPDGSDEHDCGALKPANPPVETLTCRAGQSRCVAPGSQHYHCIFSTQWCDGMQDCKDGSDENREHCNNECSGSYEGPSGVLVSPQFPGLYPRSMECLYFLHVAMGSVIQLRPTVFSLTNLDNLQVYDSADKSSDMLGEFHEKYPMPPLLTSSTNRLLLVFVSDSRTHHGFGFNITYQQKGVCVAGQAACGFGEEHCYLDPTERCDGVWQCPLRGGDERGCHHCNDNMFPCGDSAAKCYSLDERCNGVGHCLEAEDEKNCTAALCGPHNGTFLCYNGRCIYESWWCDGAKDCADGSDEYKCSVLPSVNVITAAVMGSLICGGLVVLALACARRLHYLRVHGPSAHLHHASMLHIHTAELLARRRAPPLYDEAMATSRPYDEVMERGQRSTDPEVADVENGAQLDSGPSLELALVVEEEEEVVVDPAEMTDEEEEEEEESLTLTPSGVQWRRNSQPKFTTRSPSPDIFPKSEEEEEESSTEDSEANETCESSLSSEGNDSELIAATAEIHTVTEGEKENTPQGTDVDREEDGAIAREDDGTIDREEDGTIVREEDGAIVREEDGAIVREEDGAIDTPISLPVLPECDVPLDVALPPVEDATDEDLLIP